MWTIDHCKYLVLLEYFYCYSFLYLKFFHRVFNLSLSLSVNVLLLGSFGGCCFSKTAGCARMSPLFICNLASCSTWIHATQCPHIPSYTFSNIWLCERKRMANCLPVVGFTVYGAHRTKRKMISMVRAYVTFVFLVFFYDKIVRTISNLTAPEIQKARKKM